MSRSTTLKSAAELARAAGMRFPNESAEYRRAREALLIEEIELRRHIERVGRGLCRKQARVHLRDRSGKIDQRIDQMQPGAGHAAARRPATRADRHASRLSPASNARC